MKHKRDDGLEKQEDEAVDVTPVMICVFVVMCCSMLVLLYYFYDKLGASWPPTESPRGPVWGASRGCRGRRPGRGLGLEPSPPCAWRESPHPGE